MIIITLGLLASVCSIAFSFVTKTTSVRVISLTMSVICALQYFLLGEVPAAVLAIISGVFALVTLIWAKTPWMNSSSTLYALIVAYSIAFFALNGFTFNYHLLAYVGSILMVVVLMVKNPVTLKLLLIAASLTWTSYQALTGAYGQIVGQVISMVILAWSLAQILKKEKKTKAPNKERDLIDA